MAIVTLTTDFGTTDYYVSVLKGSILSAHIDTYIVDVSHDIKLYDINHGAMVLSNAYKSFPKGTVHVVCIDGTDFRGSDYIFFKHGDHTFVGPNNGLFSIAFPILPNAIFRIKENTDGLYQNIGTIVKALIENTNFLEIGDLLTPDKIVERLRLQPVIGQKHISATIIHVDHFGNLFINLKKEVFEEVRRNREFKLYYKSTDPITAIHQHYHHVPIGEVVCRFNKNHYLELSVHLGNAHEELGIDLEESVQIEFS